METLRDVELQRIADAPVMLFGMYTMGLERCLVNVALDGYGCGAEMFGAAPAGTISRYDAVCRKVQFGKWRKRSPVTGAWQGNIRTGLAPQPVLTMLRNRARRILARRTLNALNPARLLVGP